MEEDSPPEEEFILDPEILPLLSNSQRLSLALFAIVYHEFKETLSGIRRVLEETSNLIERIFKDNKAGGNLLEENNFLEDKTAILEENKLKIEDFHEQAKSLFDQTVREPFQIPPTIVENLNRSIAEMQDVIFKIRTLQEIKSRLIEFHRRKNEK